MIAIALCGFFKPSATVRRFFGSFLADAGKK